MRTYNKYEKDFIKKIEEAKKYCNGELELDLFEGGWYAMDYRSDLEGAFFINSSKYDKPLIMEETARKYNIDVIECCDYCDVSYVG